MNAYFFLPIGISSGLLVALPGAFAAVQAPPLAEVAQETKQGITLTLIAGGRTDVRDARLVALCVPAGQPVSPFLPAGQFDARWEAEIISELRAEYTFGAEVQGQLKVTLNGAPNLEGTGRVNGQPVQLNKGANKIVVEFQSPPKGEAMLRLLWSSKEFSWEPVPPTVFQHDAAAKELRAGERLRKGRLLFAQLRCSACHDAAALLPAKGEGMPELAQDAPVFADLGAKFKEPWMAAWINDPHAIRPRALMPKVFAGEAGKIDQRAADLAAYFISTGAPAEGKPLDETLVPRGGALFANLGCIACHAKPDAEGKDEFERVPLDHVKAKWQPVALKAYLKEPAKSFAWSRMPHFRLSNEEADQLSAYLLTTANRAFPAGPSGDATRAAQLLASSGCLNCHAGLPPAAAPALSVTIEAGWTKGCLAADNGARGNAPDFAFTSAQRDALQAFATDGLASLKQDAPPEFAERQIRALHCTACHARDGQASTWSTLEEEMTALQAAAPLEEGEGKPIATTVLPMLTWFGEKLEPSWMANFIAGHSAIKKPRPWIVARMPGFAARAGMMANGLALEHGFPLAVPQEPPPNPELLKAGETLVGENGGFNCIQCHALGERPATAVFEAPGPNLASATMRLRKEYYHRWMLYPLRLDPETKMPKFADDEGRTPLTDFFKGKAAEQCEAIWQYLRTFRGEMLSEQPARAQP